MSKPTKPTRRSATKKSPAKRGQTRSAKGKSGKKRERAIREVSAGGVVFKQTPRGIRFAMMQDSYGKWTFPKGHVEKGEDLEEAGARETLEELGLEEIRLLDYLGKIDIWFRDQYKQKGKLIHKDIHYFLFETRPNAKLFPDPDEHVQDAKWVPLKQVMKVSSYEDMRGIIEEALRLVKQG